MQIERREVIASGLLLMAGCAGDSPETAADTNQTAADTNQLGQLLPEASSLPSGYSVYLTKETTEDGTSGLIRRYRFTESASDVYPNDIVISIFAFSNPETAAEGLSNELSNAEDEYGTEADEYTSEDDFTYSTIQVQTESNQFLSIYVFTLGRYKITVLAEDVVSYSQSILIDLLQQVSNKYSQLSG